MLSANWRFRYPAERAIDPRFQGVSNAPPSLFEQPDPRDDKLIEAFDTINDRLGPGSIRFGRAGQAAGWQSSSAFRSPYYTTRWSDIPVVKTGTAETG